jgi:hypothetical protein
MQPNSPLLPWLACACFLLLPSAPSAKAQCGVNTISFGNIGLVSGNPFQAEIVVTRSGSTALHSIMPPRHPELVARDSEGRIRTERVVGEFKRDSGPDTGNNAEQHLIMICDPIAQTLTQIDTLNATAKIIHSRPSAPSIQRGPLRSFCSSRLLLSHDGNLRREDLGDQTIEGVEAHGERIYLPMLGAPANTESAQADNANDRWCSDQLAAVVLTVSSNPKTGAKTSVAMQKIGRTEPDPALFQIPPDYAVTESVAPPLGRRGQTAASPTPIDHP